MAEETALVFWLEGAPTAEDIEALESAMRSLAGDWTLGPPEVLDHREGGLRSVGCALRVHDPLVGPVDPLIDQTEYGNAEAVLEVVRRLSTQRDLTFVVQYHGEEIGSVEDGEESRSVRLGLFGEWRKQIR